MIHGDAASRALVLLSLLKEKTDSIHPMSMPNLIAELELRGYTCDRRTIYTSINALNENGFDIVFTRFNGGGYFLKHTYSPGEILILTSQLLESNAISKEVTEQLNAKLLNELSLDQRKSLKLNPPADTKTENNEVMGNIELLLQAVSGAHPLEFRYYDIEINREKRYRRNRETYRQIPCSVLASNGWYYGVFYSEKHKNFAAYRIDKMDQVRVVTEEIIPVRFDAEAWIHSSFRMYKGEAETLTAVFDRSLANALFDQFGHSLIISEVNEETFTANIRTAVTPTLIAWLLQFYDRITIQKPQSLINEMQKIADTLQTKYGGVK